MAIGDYLGVSTMACIGGTNVRQDMDKLRSGVQLVVGEHLPDYAPRGSGPF